MQTATSLSDPWQACLSGIINYIPPDPPAYERPVVYIHPAKTDTFIGYVISNMRVNEWMFLEEICALTGEPRDRVQKAAEHLAKKGWVEHQGQPTAYRRTI